MKTSFQASAFDASSVEAHASSRRVSKMASEKKSFVSRAEIALLQNRTREDLSQVEFATLLRSYNAVGAREEAFFTALVATRKFSDDWRLLRWHRDVAHGWLVEPSRVAAEFLRCIDQGIGPRSFWRMALADHYIHAAWEGDEEMLGSFPLHPAHLSLAARQLEKAQVTAADFQGYWGLATGDLQAAYEMVFDGLLRYEEFAQLRRLR